MKGYYLGIDVGTSSVKITVVVQGNEGNKTSRILLGSVQEPYKSLTRPGTEEGTNNNDEVEQPTTTSTTAVTTDDISALIAEQHAEDIINAVCSCFRQAMEMMRKHSSSFAASLLPLRKVAVCGQMHGVILWNNETRILEIEDKSYRIDGPVSNLITWQDQRCCPEFVQSLPASNGPLSTGYGCASLFWLAKCQPDYLQQFTLAGTIADFAVAMLCNLPAVVMSDQNAASWGYYDIDSKCWQADVLNAAGFPVRLLPSISPAGTEVGKTTHSWSILPTGVSVYIAAGDAQCSVMSTQFCRHQAVLNMGTSCQLAFLSNPSTSVQDANLQRWPYKGDNYLSVLASMNGGNVLSNFVRMLKSWFSELGMDVADQTIWSKLSSMKDLEDTELKIEPMILKERGTAGRYKGATVTNILPSNISLSQVYQQTCLGIVQNIQDMLPSGVLLDNGITEIMCTGSVFTRHPFMLTAVGKLFTTMTAVNTCADVDAAFGAILMTQ